MRVQLIKVDGKTVGYTLVAEDRGDQAILKEVQQLNFLAFKRREKVEYDGITLDTQNNVAQVFFTQHNIAVLPDHNKTKQAMYKALLQEGVPA